MAKDKKSVVLYCDIIHTVEELNDEEAGRLFKHYLRYVNDLNPTAPDKLTQVVFEPIKQNLKRDLKKWEKKSERNKEIAIEAWEKRKNANAYERIKNDTKNTVNVNVNVNDNVNDNKENTLFQSETIEIVKSKIPKLENPFYKPCVDFWLKEFRIEWEFGGMQGKALNSIIKKIQNKLKQSEKEINAESVLDVFKVICFKLPDWYKDKDLQIIDSKFNEIITEIKNESNGNTKNAKPVSKYHN